MSIGCGNMKITDNLSKSSLGAEAREIELKSEYTLKKQTVCIHSQKSLAWKGEHRDLPGVTRECGVRVGTGEFSIRGPRACLNDNENNPGETLPSNRINLLECSQQYCSQQE